MPPSFDLIPDRVHRQQLRRCPLCGHAAGMWEVHQGKPGAKAVACERDSFMEGPLGPVQECPLSVPSPTFAQSTPRAAADLWNRFAEAAEQARADMKFRTAA